MTSIMSEPSLEATIDILEDLMWHQMEEGLEEEADWTGDILLSMPELPMMSRAAVLCLQATKDDGGGIERAREAYRIMNEDVRAWCDANGEAFPETQLRMAERALEIAREIKRDRKAKRAASAKNEAKDAGETGDNKPDAGTADQGEPMQDVKGETATHKPDYEMANQGEPMQDVEGTAEVSALDRLTKHVTDKLSSALDISGPAAPVTSDPITTGSNTQAPITPAPSRPSSRQPSRQPTHRTPQQPSANEPLTPVTSPRERLQPLEELDEPDAN